MAYVVCAPASPGATTLPSECVAVVPLTWMRFPTRTARLNPATSSHVVPESTYNTQQCRCGNTAQTGTKLAKPDFCCRDGNAAKVLSNDGCKRLCSHVRYGGWALR